ncbi:uncharacterized protein LOC105204160 [Solenopsis invicta]|uniref:uncharacterized protein LOC105204160 n=1 Tax=Solenopsis invicta TaxID=13686 RepID=UPI000595CD83|nr:uncharacterized protein LOC105204160 [Solenopsis invicta]
MRKPLGEQVKTLGLFWRVEEDSLTYRVKEPPSEIRITKKTILSIISQIYDPLGLINPIGWDESLPENLHTTWKKYCQQLHKLEEISIPRGIIATGSTKIEIHGFCDASEKAYGACLYLRSTNSENQRTCQLICAKSRVAPIKKISLPRLELCGALLLSRLMEKVVNALTWQVEEKHYWCDSTVTLAWIKGEPSRWKTFVAHRVTEIQKTSTEIQWHHIRSEEYSADMLSRGVELEKLKFESRWWKGPVWLENETVYYPLESSWLSEIPEGRVMSTMVNVEPGLSVWTRYSSLKQLKHVITYCLRFSYNCRKATDRLTSWLSVKELEEALNIILKQHQNSILQEK